MYLDENTPTADDLPPVQVGLRITDTMSLDTAEPFWVSVTPVAIEEDAWLETFATGPIEVQAEIDVLGKDLPFEECAA